MVAQYHAIEKAFPYGPVLILALCLTVNAYTLVNLFPYVGLMVKDLLGLSTINESGYYAGYIASSFTFGRFLSSYVWGYATDAIGRKPVLIIGLSAIIVCSISFGLSSNFVWAITSRLILGLLNGVMPAVRTLIHEICGPEDVVKGMAYIGGSRGVGLVTGTAIGGLLAQPTLAYPRFFSATGIFAMYPFLLPNLVGALLALSTLPLVVAYVPETKIDRKSRAERDPINSCNTCSESAVSPESDATPERSHRPERRDHLIYDVLGRKERSPLRKCDATISSPGKTNGGRGIDCVVRGPTRTQLMSAKSTGSPTEQTSALLPGNRMLAASLDATETGVPNDKSPTNSDRYDENGLQLNSGRGQVGVWGPGGILSLPSVTMILVVACMVQMISIGFEEVFPLWVLSTPSAGGLGWGTHQIGQVLGVAGLALIVLQLGVIPHVTKHVGIVSWQRAGCIVGVPAFLAVPCARLLSWGDTSLFVVLAGTNVLTMCCVSAVMLMLTVASTSVVPQQQRGKLSGMFNTAESLGRFMGPASFSVMFAWSISPSARGWVDFHLVFILPAVVMAVILALSWNSFHHLNNPAKQGGGCGDSAAVAGDG